MKGKLQYSTFYSHMHYKIKCFRKEENEERNYPQTNSHTYYVSSLHESFLMLGAYTPSSFFRRKDLPLPH